MKTLQQITDQLVEDLDSLLFTAPITCVYNPLIYAGQPYDLYLRHYGKPPRKILLIGMNPGPWGMAQTGIPFGEVAAVKEWLQIHAPVDEPEPLHPKRPVTGFHCRRSEVSGRRLWGWAQKEFGTPSAFFKHFFVINYCPLLFFEESGKNRTPDTLRKNEKSDLFAVCNRALRDTVLFFKPTHVIGVGKFAAQRTREALAGLDVNIGSICHPSPANPKANRGWEGVVEKEFAEIGIDLQRLHDS